MVTLMQKIDLLASLLARAGMTPVEIDWANIALNELRVMIAEAEAAKLKPDAPTTEEDAA